ncbi:MAG: aldo/keto reductase [Chitinivibrionales bacterium]
MAIGQDIKIDSTIELNDGVRMPVFGFGTWQLATGKQGLEALMSAIENDYRLIDTARAYDNEELVGEAIQRSAVSREKLFITSKLWQYDHGYNGAREAVQKSLVALKLDYIDLYLIHWPRGEKIAETWKGLVEMKQEGVCRSIGVSNFGPDDIREITESSDVVPSVNQVEYHVLEFPRRLQQFCEESGIQIEAYSPLSRARGFRAETIRSIAADHQRLPGQIMLRWVLQHNAIPIPKSSNPTHIHENAQVFDFELSEEEMRRLDELSR